MLRLTNTRPIYKEYKFHSDFWVTDLERELNLAEFEFLVGTIREGLRHYLYSILGYCGGYYDPVTKLAYPADMTDDKLGFRQRLLC